MRLDAEGVCFGCRNAASKHAIDWDARRRAFVELADRVKARAAGYDVVIPVSGGKDSFWQVVTCLEHGLRPLCVTYAYPGRTALGERNLRTLVELGVDHVDFRLNPVVERRLVDRAFRETGISGLVSHMAIYAYPLRVALAYDIPLVVYGENSAFEYGSEDDALVGARVDRAWLQKFGVTAGTIAADWVSADISAADLTALTLPAEQLLRDRDVHAIFLGYYFRWDPMVSRDIAERRGFTARAEGARVGHYDFVNIDDDMIGVHHHAKWHKFGITRSWDTLSMEIRNGRMTRAAAIDMLRARGEETPWEDIEVFCQYLGMSRREYVDIVEGFRNRALWTRRNDRWVIDQFLIPDFAWPADPVVPA